MKNDEKFYVFCINLTNDIIVEKKTDYLIVKPNSTI